jgi:hypothetical protein
MDPLSAAAAAVSIVCGIIGAVNAAHSMYARRKKRKAEKTAASAQPNGSSALVHCSSVPTGAVKFSVHINYIMSRFGQHPLDGAHRIQRPLALIVAYADL